MRDRLFTMNQVAGLEAICAQPGFEDATPDLVQANLEVAAKFAAGVLDPINLPVAQADPGIHQFDRAIKV